MNTSEILSAIDAELARLQHARSVLSGSAAPKRRGRPPASASSPTVVKAKRRTLSPEARKKIAEAQRKRWAKQKKQS